MRVLVACEFSGVVRDAFAARGHDAWSCDIEPSETPGQHYQGDVRDFLEAGWDLLIAHPPCTHLAVSGARWFRGKKDEQAHGLGFVLQLWAAPVERIALENPISVLSSRWRKPDQIIQPWQFGHGETKATCLWLRRLPKLRPTQVVEGREPRVHFAPPATIAGRIAAVRCPVLPLPWPTSGASSNRRPHERKALRPYIRSKALKYNRREPVDCQALGEAAKAWFYVNEGSITVVLSTGGQAVLTRKQLKAALAAMRPLRS